MLHIVRYMYVFSCTIHHTNVQCVMEWIVCYKNAQLLGTCLVLVSSCVCMVLVRLYSGHLSAQQLRVCIGRLGEYSSQVCVQWSLSERQPCGRDVDLTLRQGLARAVSRESAQNTHTHTSRILLLFMLPSAFRYMYEAEEKNVRCPSAQAALFF